MKNFVIAGAVFAASITGAFADLCADGSTDDDGNYYCQEVTAITYTGLDGSGSFQAVNEYLTDSKSCSTTTQTYSGSMTPLDEDLAIHLRGPFQLNKFAVYTPSTSSSSRKIRKRGISNKHQHGHQRFHQHHKEVRAAQEVVEKRQAACEMVSATIDGELQSWMNSYECTSAAAASATTSAEAATTAAATTSSAAATSTASTSAGLIALNQKEAVAATSSSAPSETSSASSASSSTASSSSSSGDWSRVAYYDAAAASASGLTFVNHNGGDVSGSWSDAFGGSLSYASEDGCSAASSSTVFSGDMSSSDELIIMSDAICSDDSCGTVFPGGVNYHGFSGASKAFVFEFSMALNASTGNMPAIWALNSRITNNIQYAAGSMVSCNCWNTGCGEMDIFEVLAAGDLRAKSTLHGNSPCLGGDSDYFARPTETSITLVALLNGSNIHIKVLDSSDTFGDFDSSYSSSTVDSFCDGLLDQSSVSGLSVFPLAS